jgi:hemerythrin-like domain-containing protein
MEMLSPWSGRRGARRFPRLAHEHGELRTAMRRLELATSQPACPPAGHAFLGLVATLAGYFRTELEAHAVVEEATLYPQLEAALGAAEVAELLAEHQELRTLAERFEVQARDLAEPRWADLREGAATLTRVLRAHLAHEEAAIDHASLPPCGGGAR